MTRIKAGGYTRGDFTAKKTGGTRKLGVYTVYRMSDGEQMDVVFSWGDAMQRVDELFGRPLPGKESDEDYVQRVASIPRSKPERHNNLPPIRAMHAEGDPF